MPNFHTDPPVDPYPGDVTVYHGMPHGLCDGLRRPITADLYVDTSRVHEVKRRALAAHASQKDWLDVTQGMGSYLDACDDMSRRVGQLAGGLAHAAPRAAEIQRRPQATRVFAPGRCCPFALFLRARVE
jgi:hypothetical protein